MSRFYSIEDLAEMPEPKWLIDGLFEANSLVMVAGPEGNYKSFLAIDWTLTMAAGRQWHNRRTQPSKVLYALGEGKANLIKRIDAWMRYYSITPAERDRIVDNFRCTFEVPQMAAKSSVDAMLATLRDENFEPDVIVIDTFARSFVGLDENSQKDTGLWIESADRLRQMGYTVIFLHHTVKNQEFGLKYRGSTVIGAAMDTAFTLAKDQDDRTVSKLVCTKQKDHDEGEPLYFKRQVIHASDTDTTGSIVLVPTTKAPKRTVEDVAKERELDKLLDSLLEDATYESDRARARELSKRTGMTEAAAQTKIRRKSDSANRQNH